MVIEPQNNARNAVITELLPRTTRLSRSHPSNPRLEHVIAANVDQALIVSSIKNPPLTVGIIDRYVISAEYGGITPVICLNKTDLAGDDRRHLDIAESYDRAGYPVLMTSTRTGDGMEELITIFAGKTTVLAGHSGVGKSSLINCVQPGLALRTAPLGWKGTHCTAKATLIKLHSGGYVVDTPGIRELQPWDIEGHEVQQFFPEIWRAAPGCRMPDCTHIHEPDCAVKAVVDAGAIPAFRYDSYLGIMDSIETTRVPRNTDVDDPASQIPQYKRQRSRRSNRQEFGKIIDEYWDERDGQ